jgi:hypothetical protein
LEQILLYIVTISGFSGFMLGLYSLLIPVLQRRGIHLPFVNRDARDGDDYEYDDNDDDAHEFAAASFSARRTSLLERLPRRAAPRASTSDEDDEAEDLEDAEPDDDGLLGDLDLTKERAEVEAEDEDGYEEDELAELTYEAEVDPVLDELAEDEMDEEDEEEDEEEGEESNDEEEYEDDEEEEQAPEQPVVHVVSGGGGNDDMLALFGEGSDAVKEVEAWRADLPDPTIDELLAEAQELRALLQGRRPRV